MTIAISPELQARLERFAEERGTSFEKALEDALDLALMDGGLIMDAIEAFRKNKQEQLKRNASLEEQFGNLAFNDIDKAVRDAGVSHKARGLANIKLNALLREIIDWNDSVEANFDRVYISKRLLLTLTGTSRVTFDAWWARNQDDILVHHHNYGLTVEDSLGSIERICDRLNLA